jgi:hypothetical protein
MKLTTKQINEIVKNDEFIQEWRMCNVSQSKLKGGKRSLKYMKNGWEVPTKLKNNILKSLNNQFNDVENIETIEWKIGSHYLGDYDYLRIVKVD